MSLKNAVGGVALIAGTAIGAAILALPIATAHWGFFPTLFMYLLCWFFMTLSALYLLEANLAVGPHVNLISIAEKFLGKKGKYFTWMIYLVLLYALTAAYLTGLGVWIQTILHFFNIETTSFYCALSATFFALLIILCGTAVTDWVNRLLMIGLLGAFVILLFTALDHVQPALLFAPGESFDLRPLPLIITGFGSAIVIPTLTDYLHGKPRQLYQIVFIGSLIPLLVYMLWETVIIGTIPLEGQTSLLEIQQNGHAVKDVPYALQKILHYPWIMTVSSYFSIFALITSLLGVCLSLFDFLKDGLHLPTRCSSKILIAIITFLPPLLFLLFYPKGFAFILSFAGFFVAILLGILPTLFAWQSRYHFQRSLSFQVGGGKLLLFLTLLFFCTIVGIEGFNQWEMWAK